MVFPPRNPPFRHETETDADGNERIVAARRPDDEWYELREGVLTRVTIVEGEEKRLIVLRRFELIGRYPPEGAAFEWGFRARFCGKDVKLPSRTACNEQALADFLEDHGLRHIRCALPYVRCFFEWIT